MDGWSRIEALCAGVNSREQEVSFISTPPVSGNELGMTRLIEILIGKQMTFLNSNWDFSPFPGIEQKYTRSIYSDLGE